MLIGLCGPPSSGKRTVAEFLRSQLGFVVIPTPSFLLERTSSKREADGFTSNGKLLDAAESPSPVLLSQCWKHNVNVVIAKVEPAEEQLDELLKRPYFLLIYVDAPIMVRFMRSSDASLEDFVAICDSMMCQKRYPTLDRLRQESRLRIVNDHQGIDAFHEHLQKLDLTNGQRYRPSWDSYFMSLARLASERTNCMKRRVGCVIERDRRVVATGYNGTPKGLKNCGAGGCERCNRNAKRGIGLDLCLCLHAEENALIEAGRERCTGSTLFTTLYPCMSCAKKIVQAGVSRVVYSAKYATDVNVSQLFRAGEVTVDAFRANAFHANLNDRNSGLTPLPN
eukprot:Plantae.Rhodophyta-Hildenbrandia_rubra.ctg9445.p1 GENE.Plantae.Rhodophyta-Hildenbrandia_rubra.ctg9445~~Plantae.Rhodophyta-Hildenbrandia_rubra.ctg9445.p1  ORF type:complete len:338 (+),score=33.54 Plantae.Rhodophyta-Hildenbrandia_rubra.ctg9445:290-1303(+)